LPAADAQVFGRYVGAAALTGLLVTLAAARLLPGWLGATLGVGQGLAWCGVMLLRHPRPWLTNLVVFGLVAGVVELAADAWLVHGTRTLVYPSGGPFLLASPAYMPAAWFGMLSLGLALAAVLGDRWPLVVTTGVVTIVTGVYIPVYEALAHVAGWWSYVGTPLLFGAVPPYVVVGELLLAVPLAFATRLLARVPRTAAVWLGAAQGAWIFISYGVAWGLCAGR
jgi:hypothetical protein